MIFEEKRPIIEIGNDPSKIRTLPIKECGEKLVQVRTEKGIFVSPQYHERGIHSAANHIFVRIEVLNALRIAASKLPKDINLLLWDGLRTLETQMEIYEDAKLAFPLEKRDALIELYLSKPPESEAELDDFPPPHSTGGAIDLTLCDATGQPLDMGANFDEFRENAWLAYFEDDRSISYGDKMLDYKNYRRILYWAMIEAGFAPYPWEFWHYELGTIVAANFHKLPIAQYGAALSRKFLQ